MSPLSWTLLLAVKGVFEEVEEFPRDVALEATDDLSLAQALGGAPVDVVTGGLVAAHPDDGHDVEGAVRGAVAACPTISSRRRISFRAVICPGSSAS